MSRKVVLVGLMGAGKTTTGRRLAELRGCRFVDLDDEIARRAGRSIGQLFDEVGEAGFRKLEAEATEGLAEVAETGSGPGIVVAAGGGWMSNPAARAALPDAITVWLKVTAAEASRRMAHEAGRRPLLAGENPERVLEALLVERLPAYGEATYTVDTIDRTPVEVARLILARMEDRDRRDT